MRKSGMLIQILLTIFLLVFTNCAQTYDVVITGGMIYDGSGGQPYAADIGIKDGYITKIGSLDKSGGTVIDVHGLYVAPGFIDIHTHCDRKIQNTELKSAKNYLMQGVTTVVTGNCGSGTYQVDEFFETLEQQGIGLNVVHLIGHGSVRRAVMELADREPTPDELDQMRRLISLGMEDGAVGLSTGLFYAPGNFAKTGEVVELAHVVHDYGGIYASHIRDESNYSVGLKEAIKEAIAVGEQADVPVEISHIKALGKPVWGSAPEICEIIESAQSRGMKVYADQYPYNASSTGLSAAVIPRWVQADGQLHDRLNDPGLSARIRKEIAENIDRRGGAETIVIASYSVNRELEGKNLREISEIFNKPVIDTAIELVLNDSPGIVSFNMQDSDVEYFMKKPYVMTASDGSLPVFGEAVPHPRSYGTFPRKIRKYVVEKGVVSLEQMIRSSSALPADMLGLYDRGMLKEGYAADIVIFDLNTIADKATFAEPHQYSEGIEFLLINGEVVVENGSYEGRLAGKPLRMNRK